MRLILIGQFSNIDMDINGFKFVKYGDDVLICDRNDGVGVGGHI